MPFARDAGVVEEVVRGRDPSFENCDSRALEKLLAEMHSAAGASSRDGFLLAAMELCALAGNAHSRVIPNEAISVCPLRIIAIGTGWQAVGHGELASVGGVLVEELFRKLRPYLAGPWQRQRVIGGILFAWPAALAAAEVEMADGIRYGIADAEGGTQDLWLGAADCVPATEYYPVQEWGYPTLGLDPHHLPDRADDGIIFLRLPSFSRGFVPTLLEDIAAAAARVTGSQADILIDLRGNTGGSFIDALPLIHALRDDWRGNKCALLVDKFSFSAAIVFVAMVTVHLAGRVRVFGELMGDDLEFWAEGGTIALPDSGASLRWSDQYHDWRTADVKGRPNEFQHLLVAAGDMAITPAGPESGAVVRAACGWLDAGK